MSFECTIIFFTNNLFGDIINKSVINTHIYISFYTSLIISLTWSTVATGLNGP